MLKSKILMATATAAILIGAGSAFAQSSNEATIVFESARLANKPTVVDLVEDLAASGYTYIEIRRTFLGRAHVFAYLGSEIREVVINPTTGEVLRDLVMESDGELPSQANAQAQAANNNGNGNNGNNGNSGNSGNGNNGNNGNGNNGNGKGNN